MAQFRELAAFAQFGADQLDKATQAQLARGQRLTEVLKQDQYAPLSVQQQVLALFVATSGFEDSIPVNEVRRFEKEFLQFAETNYGNILKEIAEKKALDDGIKASIKKAVEAFKERFTATLAASRSQVNTDHGHITRFSATHPLGEEYPADYPRHEVRLRSPFTSCARGCTGCASVRKGTSRVLRSTMARIESPQHPLVAKRPEERILVMVLAGERGLAGAFNSNILKQAAEFVRSKQGKKIVTIPVGKKSRDCVAQSWL